tara:strand:+ start:226 stop:960 length:735 start_codon:yes stop_codon:yes gene_type:complete
MKITGTAIKLGAFSLVLLMFTAIIIIVFGQVRFDRTTGYSAVFSSASGLRPGQFVRASGVEVGKVEDVTLIEGGSKVKVDFNVDRSLPLFDETRASIRYLNLIGDRYLDLSRGDSNTKLAAGATIPIELTEPALDLDALIGGFRPVFQSLEPEKVNTIAQSLITVFQGQGGTINDILDQTASLTKRAGRPGPRDRRRHHQPQHRAGHDGQASAAVRRDHPELRGPHHRVEESCRSTGHLGRRHQ